MMACEHMLNISSMTDTWRDGMNIEIAQEHSAISSVESFAFNFKISNDFCGVDVWYSDAILSAWDSLLFSFPHDSMNSAHAVLLLPRPRILKFQRKTHVKCVIEIIIFSAHFLIFFFVFDDVINYTEVPKEWDKNVDARVAFNSIVKSWQMT